MLLLILRPAVCQNTPATGSLPGPVTADTLEARIAEVEVDTTMGEEASTKLAELYRKALGNLRAASANAQAEEDFRRAAATAPTRIQAIQEEIAKSAASPSEDNLDIQASTSLPRIEQLLQKEEADLAAADARRVELEKRLDEETDRPTLIRQRLTEAKQQQEEVATQLKLPPPAGEGPATSAARRWALEIWPLKNWAGGLPLYSQTISPVAGSTSMTRE